MNQNQRKGMLPYHFMLAFTFASSLAVLGGCGSSDEPPEPDDESSESSEALRRGGRGGSPRPTCTVQRTYVLLDTCDCKVNSPSAQPWCGTGNYACDIDCNGRRSNCSLQSCRYGSRSGDAY